ncbi:MAG TPA: RagB/SusD family nutrient uptake outer membrane protein [Sphingobacteriaceae bacterium]
MKKILIFLLMVCLISCKDALVEAPKSVAVETFYNTAEEVQTAVNAIYTPLKSTTSLGGLYFALQEALTDYSYGRGSYGIVSEFQGLDGTNITRTGQIWDNLYLAIRNANLVIANAPKGKDISQTDITKTVAEAKFLRAFTYFILVRNWGGVILRTEGNMTALDVPRSSEADIYTQIIKDLTVAETNLPPTVPVSGHPTKWSAKTLLADVYFYQGKYKEARDKADEVIKSNVYKLVDVTVSEDFQKIYGPNVINTTEEIFYLKYNQTQGWQGPHFAHHPGAPYYNRAGFFAHYTDNQKNPVYKNWDNRDLRKEHDWYIWNIGLGNTTLLNRKYRDPQRTAFAANDYPLYRYADLLLLYAEADARANNAPTVDAMLKLNMVHRRAYGRNPNAPSEFDFVLGNYNLNSFVDLVLKERGYETQYEGKRWLDLKRTGRVKEIIKATVGKDVADTHLLWPIPVSEMNFNPALDPQKDQNPGY